MNDFNRCNKVTGIHWVKKSIENIQISIKLKPQDSILSLPKFEDYTESNDLSLQRLEIRTEEYNFKWQEKAFSLWEYQRYSDVHNCITDTELNFNELLNNEDLEPSKVFTYIHEDFHLPLPEEIIMKSSKFDISNLNLCFEKLNLGEKLSKVLGEDSNSMGHLFRSEENIAEKKDQWISMHIAFDNSEYNDDSQLLLKQEATLLSLYYNTTQQYLLISPDVNNLELNPYTVESTNGIQWGYQYSVHVGFQPEEDGEELEILLKKLFKKWERKQRLLLNFAMPPIGKKHYFVSLEILSAAEFDGDDIYVEFHIKVPEEITCEDNLHGRTHVTTALRYENIEEWHFGHLVELNLEAADGTDLQPLQLFCEVISTDWWGRHRTEGYCYYPLTLDPGYYTKTLSCRRPEELDEVEAASRRFFVGGCHLIKDLDVLAMPQLQDTNIKYVSTGTLTIRYNIISQAPLPGLTMKPEALQGSSSASALLLGAEAAIRQYRKARARLAAATDGLATVHGQNGRVD